MPSLAPFICSQAQVSQHNDVPSSTRGMRLSLPVVERRADTISHLGDLNNERLIFEHVSTSQL